MSVELLLFQVRAFKLPEPKTEHQFHKTRKWRFDLCWPDQKVAAEFEGGTYTNGRHTRGSGFEKDCEKYNTATLQNWAVFRFTAKSVKSGEAVAFLRQALK